jgi:hypothetical protein
MAIFYPQKMATDQNCPIGTEATAPSEMIHTVKTKLTINDIRVLR